MKAALHEIQSLVLSSNAGPSVHADPFMIRLQRVLPGAHASNAARNADLAGLLRQAILRAPISENEQRELVVPLHVDWPDASLWSRFSFDVLPLREGRLRIRPRAWKPFWLDAGAGQVISAATEEDERRRSRSVPSDPAVTEYVGWESYSSPGLRAAVHAAFLTPAGSTTTICLPTGGGKSLAFQLPALAWQNEGGLTVVIVPTVALAKDQETRFRTALKSRRGHQIEIPVPLAFHGGLDESDRRAMLQAVRGGQTPIVFTSPEAAIGVLRDPLFEAARQGRLRIFAVDEAHLIAQWGEEFRPEFQSLAGLRDSLLEACPPAAPFRTLLLTATLTFETHETLRSVFGQGRCELVAELALRPEIGFLINTAQDEGVRTPRVLEAIDHLPRPLILYTTVRQHAADWYQRLLMRGYGRVRLVRGGDLADEAGSQILQDWKQGNIDIVVATSAFGLGMDQANVRSVVHACLPETIDRYYQEVGRAGRDGNAAVALLATAPQDSDIARALATKRRISVERGFERWQMMWWWSRRLEPEDVYVLRLDVSPPDITSPGERNESWNLRTLVLMARAGLIAFSAHAPPKLERALGEDDVQFEQRRHDAYERFYEEIAVRVVDERHLDEEHWNQVVSRVRSQLYAQDAHAMDLVRELLNLQRPLNDLFREVYKLSDPSVIAPRLLGSCPVTRERNQVSFVSADPDVVSFSRTDLNPDPTLARVLAPCTDGARRSWISYVPYPKDALELRQWRRTVVSVLRQVVSRGVLELSVPDGICEQRDWTQLLAAAAWRFVVRGTVGHGDDSMQLPRLTFVDPTDANTGFIDAILRLPRPQHIIILPIDTPDPDRPGGRLLSRTSHLTFEEFTTRLGL
jgi:superfamily II DNA/RNA helicase